MYKLLYPEFLFLVFIPVLLRLLPPVNRGIPALYFPAAGSVGDMFSGSTPKRDKILHFLTGLLMYIGWCLWCVALTAPSYQPLPEAEIVNKRNILLASDISLSMETCDWFDVEQGKRISRWEAVRKLNEQLIAARHEDRFAYVVFGQEAYLVVPFTSEPELVLEMQQKIQLGDAGLKTHVGNAIAVSSQHFRSDSIAGKVMILVTDGLDTQDGISPMQMAEEAAGDSIVIYTVAMGSPSEGFRNVDHRQLEKIAECTGGRMFLASSVDDLHHVVEEIDRLEPMEFATMNELPVKPLYIYPLSISLLMFAFVICVNLFKY